jgi:hypothetical protein
MSRPLPSCAHTRRPAARASLIARALSLATLFAVSLLAPRAARAQTLEDAELLQPRQAAVTVMYGHDAWDQYWEGSLKRTNGNIGTITTSSITSTVGYGVNSRLTLFASLPYVSTEASQGVLHGMQGRQDFTFMAKYRVANPLIAGRARLKLLAVGAAGIPTSDYTPDFLPMSIGLHSKSLTARAAAHLQDRTGWFIDGFGERMWRANVTLDRSSYYTNGQWIESNEVAMPDVAVYRATFGWQREAWCIPVGITAQRTLGGGDIRRQDMPFVSNRMNFTRVGAAVQYWLPRWRALSVRLEGNRALTGRNVGQSTTLSAGLLYVFHF